MHVLLIGGLDPTGGAGITADARMAHAHGVHPLTVATCLTVQNRSGFRALNPVPANILRDTLHSAFDDGPVHAIKVGLCGTAEIVQEVFAMCSDAATFTGQIVVDPVLAATSGGLVTGDELVAAYREILPAIGLLTPNLEELERLAPGGVEELLDGGCTHVLVKGGHGTDTAVVSDRLVTAAGTLTLRHPRIDVGPIHGTGCALATAAAARLAKGADLEGACRGAVADVVKSLGRTAPSSDGRPVPLAISASRNPV